MKSPSIPLREDDDNFAVLDCSQPGGPYWWFCGPRLRKCFGLPKETKFVEFKAFFRPGKGRYAVRICSLSSLEVDGQYYYMEKATIQNILEKTKGREEFYVEVYYW